MAVAGEFASLLAHKPRGRLKVYIGSAAGTGKTFRMLQEGHDLRRRGVDVVIGFVETHGRLETEAQVGDLEVVPRRSIGYRGITLEEMDTAAILARRPEVALVDELAHTNVPGSDREKRWEDVLVLLDAGIHVVSAVNVQHLESLNDVIARALGVTVRETIPDWILTRADQVVNLDIPPEDLRRRLEEGKIYPPAKVDRALANFFTPENLTTLRELALREVAGAVDRQREAIVAVEDRATRRGPARPVDRVLVGLSSDPAATRSLLRQATRIAGRLNSDWHCVYVRTRDEAPERIDAAVQRRLVDNIQRAQAMGATVETVEADDVAEALLAYAKAHACSMLLVGPSRAGRRLPWFRRGVTARLLASARDVDVLIVRRAVEGDA